MELLRPSHRRNLLSEVIYILLNVLMAIAILVVVLAIDSPVPAFGLVLLSKWRVLAVRPQYWGTNIIANTVDIIVSLSLVILLYAASGSLYAQIVLTILYIGWLLLIKPRSRHGLVVLQAGVGVFFGVSALMQVSYGWWASPVVLAMWVIGYSTARHVLTAYKESHFSLLSLLWGFVMAEIGWLTFHWNFGYNLYFVGDIQLSQAAIISVLLGFLAERTYASYHHNEHKRIRFNDIVLPLLLVVSVVAVLLTLFGSVRTI